jgi:hypothetical protein
MRAGMAGAIARRDYSQAQTLPRPSNVQEAPVPQRRLALTLAAPVAVLVLLHVAGFAPFAMIAAAYEQAPWMGFLMIGAVGLFVGRLVDRALASRVRSRNE